ncbi:hypothetical protein B0H10DRAFT_2207570 [Mycena sp. CBHHK59/15]|nr:hypothetical protein B0H10DRAFT_2207570 [Mycena sp. CBHHK59/15]
MAPGLDVSFTVSMLDAFLLPFPPSTLLRPISTTYPDRVDFADEVAAGLAICHGDIHETNFIVNDQDHVYALDFGHICFLPPTFVTFALEASPIFTRRVAAYVKFPKSEKNLKAMQIVAGQLVLHGSSSYGLPDSARASNRASPKNKKIGPHSRRKLD